VDISVRTSIQGSDETPISRVHHVAVAVPSFSPPDTERVVRAVEARPEDEVETTCQTRRGAKDLHIVRAAGRARLQYLEDETRHWV
jgi:hypothetical protein